MVLKSSFRNIILNILLIIILSSIILLIKNQETKGIFVTIAVIIIIYLFFLIIAQRPTKIKIDRSNLTITFNQFLVFNTQISENITELTQSYKKEVGPKGVKRNVYRIYKGNRTILKIVPNYNGWNTNKLQTLSNYLQKLGVNLIN